MNEPNFTLTAPTPLDEAAARLAALMDQRADLEREIAQAKADVANAASTNHEQPEEVKLCATPNAPAPTSLAVPITAQSTAGSVASNAAPTFQPDARPSVGVPPFGHVAGCQCIVCRPVPSAPTSGTPRCDGVKVDAGWIIASHSEGEFVPLEVAQSMEAQLMDAQEQYDGAIAEVVQLRQQLASVTAERDEACKEMLARNARVQELNDELDRAMRLHTEDAQQLQSAQTRADVAERDAQATLQNALAEQRRYLGAIDDEHIAERDQARKAGAEFAAERDLALRELAELKAKIGEKV